MLAIEMRFLAGRYHATPWGRHVNEGAAEWPPSPWRLLRALIAVWKQRLADEISELQMHGLLEVLTAPPQFYLPPAVTAHTRHYMPWFKKGPGDKTKVFDTFVALALETPVTLLWPVVELNSDDQRLLTLLLKNLTNFGRAESWCQAKVLSEKDAAQAAANCLPYSPGTDEADHELVPVLCADPVGAFQNAYTPKHKVVSGRGRSKTSVDSPLYDPDWHLSMETLALHKDKWSDPPGSCWVQYSRKADCFEIKSEPRHRTTARIFTVARYSIDSPVLPLVADTLPLAAAMRRNLMGIYRRIQQQELYGCQVPANAERPVSAIFSGKTQDGQPLQGHTHAYYLPTDEDGDGRLDHITVFARGPMGSDGPLGFGTEEVRALDRCRSIKLHDGDPLNLLLVGLGREEDFRECPLFAQSCVWISATPFVATRYPKRNGQKRDAPELLGQDNQRAFAAQVIQEEVARLRQRCNNVSSPSEIVPLPGHRIGARGLRPIQFHRNRPGKRSDDGGRRAAGGFRIVFPTPVAGPICLGHSSHFGLGLFVPEGK